jgi:hypothetical protein
MAMMAITTSNSIKVKPSQRRRAADSGTARSGEGGFIGVREFDVLLAHAYCHSRRV